MITVNSINEELNDDEGDLLNDSDDSTSFANVIYSPRWNRKGLIKKIPNKLMKNSKSMVDVQLNKQSTWCSSKLKISNEEPQPFRRPSSTHTPFDSPSIYESSDSKIVQSNQKASSSYSSSLYTNSDDFFNNNPFFNKLRNPTVAQNYGHSYFDSNSSSTDSRNANFESFFPENSTTSDSFYDYKDNLESQKEYKPSLEMHTKYNSQHRFHWSENIEYCSPWVRHRSKEIFNYVNRIFEMKKKPEILENDTERIHKDLKSPNVVHKDCSETDDNITYDIANKLCSTFLKHDETNVSKNQCPNDKHFKWSNLYQKLINHGQL